MKKKKLPKKKKVSKRYRRHARNTGKLEITNKIEIKNTPQHTTQYRMNEMPKIPTVLKSVEKSVKEKRVKDDKGVQTVDDEKHDLFQRTRLNENLYEQSEEGFESDDTTFDDDDEDEIVYPVYTNQNTIAQKVEFLKKGGYVIGTHSHDNLDRRIEMVKNGTATLKRK